MPLEVSARRKIRALAGVFRAACVCLSVGACAGPHPTTKPPHTAATALGPVTPVAVDDGAFAASAYRILVGADTGQARASLLAGVVSRQLERARARFESERPDNGYA